MKPEDYNFRDYEHLERVSPILEINYRGHPMHLTYDNTCIFSFSTPYETFTNIFHNDPDAGPMTFFDSDDLLEQLRGYRYPEYKEPYPSEKDVGEYFTWHSKVLAAELLAEMAVGNEVEDFEIEEDDDGNPDIWEWED